MKKWLSIPLLIFAAGCEMPSAAPQAKMERMQGHVTLVAGGADFVVTKPTYRRFLAPVHAFPTEVWNYLRTQPEHEDGSSLSSKGQAVWLDATGHVEEIGGERHHVFAAKEIHQMTSAHPRYLAWRRLFGDTRVTDYAD